MVILGGHHLLLTKEKRVKELKKDICVARSMLGRERFRTGWEQDRGQIAQDF